MKASYLALFVASIAFTVITSACGAGAPAAPAREAIATASPTTPSVRGTPAATSSPVPAPDIPVEDAKQKECFSCHGPGELPTIPDHSVMQDNPALCEQCHRQAK